LLPYTTLFRSNADAAGLRARRHATASRRVGSDRPSTPARGLTAFRRRSVIFADIALPLDGDAALDGLRCRAAFLVDLDGPQRVRPRALRDPHRVADLDARDERL